MPLPILAAALLPAAAQLVQGVRQRRLAKRLKESTFVPPELMMNRDLAQQQAYSRRAPGQAFAEEQARRNTANQISAAQRSFGGDANKVAAITSAATAEGNDANARIAANGAAFSERAMARVADANSAIGAQKRYNRDQYNQTKAQLLAGSDQNLFNAISNIGTAGVAGLLNKQQKAAGGVATPQQVGMFQGGGAPSMSTNPWMNYLMPATMDMEQVDGVWRQPWSGANGPTGYTPSRLSFRKR